MLKRIPSTRTASLSRAFLMAAPLALALACLTIRGQAAEPAAPPPAAAVQEAVPLLLRTADTGAAATARLESTMVFPGEWNIQFQSPQTNWTGFAELEVDVELPPDAPATIQALVYMKDWDYFWFQNLLPGYLTPGKVNHLKVSLAPGEGNWKPRGHHGLWYYRALMEPKDFGLRLFSKDTFKGTCRVAQAQAVKRLADSAPPGIRNLRANTAQVPCYGKFELTFDLPDRYADPFDPAQIAVSADFEGPDGAHTMVDGFYAQDYIWRVASTEERFQPQGPPLWHVRFAPGKPGIYRYTVTARDAVGSTRTAPGTFTATPAVTPGFVRVSQQDPRYFEFTDGSPFFPIGHNVRSPFDSRMDQQFPWAQRWPEGSAAYIRYFRSMAQNGENFGEVWSAAWSLGLEWTPLWRGYHGIGQFNLVNAWELDHVVDAADANGIYLNLVILNHGKFSTWCDPEWAGNPFNKANGGFLDSPDDYFSNPRAQEAFKKLMRYMIARWGYSQRIFAWELWSELNLTGTNANVYKTPACVDWHRQMGRWIKETDPYRHLVATHVSGDYNTQNTEIISLPEMDHCPVDAYHGHDASLYIVTLLRLTALFNNPYKKPVLVTEFGGNWNGQDIKHLDDALHAALWSATCLPLAGTPLFWWWQVVEEENFYPKYLAVSKFMKGEDRRNTARTTCTPQLRLGTEPAVGIDVQCLKDRTSGLGWLFCTGDFEKIDPVGEPTVLDLKMVIPNMTAGAYTVEFWDTTTGRPLPVRQQTTTDEQDTVTVAVPPFARDLAFKIKPAP